ncbi:MAG: patatin family protein [Paludibacteraceae bacterium]|nr:patatin family protein [Paludibacteraceae bacterium]
MKNGLVLEGGGFRGLFTSAVLDVMMERGIRFDGLVGVSAGALFGVNFKSHQIGRGLRYNLRFKDTPEYMGWRALLATGNIVGPRFAYHVVPFELDPVDAETFRTDPTEFWAVCTDIVSGGPVYHQLTEITHESIEWLRASASMPLVSTPVALDGRLLLDGGMVDSIPLEAFQRMGYERNVVILTQPAGFRKQHTGRNWLFRTVYRKYPLVASIMERRHEMYNRQLDLLAEAEKNGEVLVIRPDEPLDIGRTETNGIRMQAVYAAGLAIARRMMERVESCFYVFDFQ